MRWVRERKEKIEKKNRKKESLMNISLSLSDRPIGPRASASSQQLAAGSSAALDELVVMILSVTLLGNNHMWKDQKIQITTFMYDAFTYI